MRISRFPSSFLFSYSTLQYRLPLWATSNGRVMCDETQLYEFCEPQPPLIIDHSMLPSLLTFLEDCDCRWPGAFLVHVFSFNFHNCTCLLPCNLPPPCLDSDFNYLLKHDVSLKFLFIKYQEGHCHINGLLMQPCEVCPRVSRLFVAHMKDPAAHSRW